MIRGNEVTVSRSPLTQLLLLASALLVTACGPVVIGLSVPDGGGGGAPPLTLKSSIGSAVVGPCGLIREFVLEVNRPNVALTYSINGAAARPFTDPASGVNEPELPAGTPTSRRLLVRPGANTIVITASVGSETVRETQSITAQPDAVRVDLEPPHVEGRNVELRWSLPAGSESFFWIHFDDSAGAIDDLQGVAGGATSPTRVPVDLLDATTIGGRTHYRYQLSDLAAAAGGLLQHHYFAVRANDGCESRVVCAHTRPKPQPLLWPAANRTTLSMVTPPNPVNNVFVAEPPVGGTASSQTVVGMPPILVDRGIDATNAPEIRPPDGSLDLAMVDRDGVVFAAPNALGGLQPPFAVDDTTDVNTSGCLLPAGSTGDVLRAFAMEADGDQRPDLFILTAERLWFYFGDNVAEGLTPYEVSTQDGSAYMNWKKNCAAAISLSDLAPLPSGLQFVDGWHGDFDGDGREDLAIAVGRPQTRTDDGQAYRIYVLYQNRTLTGGYSLDWKNNATWIGVGTAFGDDGHFVVGDVDGDGRDDLVTFVHDSSTSARYRVLLMRGRGVQPVALQSNEPVTPGTETARWDQTTLVDLDHDGVLDLLSLRTVFGVATAVRIYGYRTRLTGPGSGFVDTRDPYLIFLDGSPVQTHATLSGWTRQRGHLQVRDLDRDGVSEILLRSIFEGNEYLGSRVSVFGGVLDPATGLQNWRVEQAPANIDFLPASRVPHVHFATGDLNFDGVADFCTVHERSAAAPEVVTMHSAAEWGWQRFTAITAADYPLAGTLQTGGNAAFVRSGRVDRAGDLVLGVDPNLGVTVLSARTDAGVRSGGFDRVTAKPLQGALGFGVVDARVATLPSGTRELLVLGDDGRLGSLVYDQDSDDYAFRLGNSGQPIAGATAIHPAWLDGDTSADAIVMVAGSRTLTLLGTIDPAGNRNQELTLLDTLQLPRAPELVLIETMGFDHFSEVIVVLSPQSGSEERVVEVYRTRRRDGTGDAYFDPVPDWSTSFPVAVTSIGAANFDGRVGTNIDRRKWIVGGLVDGRIMAGDNRAGPATALVGPSSSQVGSGPVEILVTDVTNDFLPDIVAYERGSSELAIFRLQPDGSQPWRFPNPGAYQFQGSGSFDNAIIVPLPEPLSDTAALAGGRVDNDVFQDLLLLSRDGARVHVVTTRGLQELR